MAVTGVWNIAGKHTAGGHASYYYYTYTTRNQTKPLDQFSGMQICTSTIKTCMHAACVYKAKQAE